MYHDVTRTPQDETKQAEDEAAKGEAAEDEAPETPRKERVLHTRVPAVLDSELKRLAKNLRTPVSNVVRVILEDALRVADRATGQVESRLRQAATVVHDERVQLRERMRSLDPLEDVLGFQPLVVAQPTSCAGCARAIARGEAAFLGVTTDPTRRLIACAGCVPAPPSPTPPSTPSTPSTPETDP